MKYEAIRESLVSANEDLRARFLRGDSVVDLVHARAAQIDEVLVGLWREHVEASGAALVAVGGYGRGELHPYSDVDIMILVESPQPDSPYGIKGVGEIGLVPTAGAVAAALHAHDGIWRHALPMTDAPPALGLVPRLNLPGLLRVGRGQPAGGSTITS